jgi:xylulose-5-phosphate/fructose-6-phosphate phosphoketolase
MTDRQHVHSENSNAEYPERELELDLRWWSAANYLTVAQIYLQDIGGPVPVCR